MSTRDEKYLPMTLSKLPIIRKFQYLSKEGQHLTVINTVLALGQGISSLFLNIYLWREMHGLVPVVLFNMIQYPAILLVGQIIGASPIKIKIKHLLGLGFILFVAAYALLMLLSSDAAHFLLLEGAIFGLANGIYWAGNNAFTYLSTTDKNRDNFYALNSSIGNIISIIAPLVGGIILSQFNLFPHITNGNYYLLFSVVISIFLCGFYYSYKLPNEYVPRISLKKTLKPFTVRVWRIAGISAFVDGFKGESIGFIVTILTFQILTKELNMAFFSSAFSVISAFVSYQLAGRLNRRNRLKFGFIGALLFIFVHLVYIFFFSTNGIILSSFIGVFANPLFGVGLASTFFLIIDSHPQHKKDYYTYITYREIPLALGRIAGASLFLLLLSLGSELIIAKTWYLMLGFIPILFFFLTHRFNKIIEKSYALTN
jgi:YQGE family putative transporter